MFIGDSLASGKTYLTNKSYNFNHMLIENNNIVDYNDELVINNITTRDIYEIISNNETINEQTVKSLIKQAKVITIALGIDELNDNANINIYMYYMDKILEIITSLNYNDIYLIGLYSDIDKINDVNKMLKDLALKYKIIYVDISNIVEDKYFSSEYINLLGHEYIKKCILGSKNNQNTID